MISSSRLAATPRQLGSSAPRKAKSALTAKVLRERIKRNNDERLPRLLDCRKWKTTARPRKTLRQPETTTGPRKTRARAGGNEPGPPADARPLGHRSCSGAPPRPQPTRGHEGLTQKALKFSARNICPNLDSRSKADLQTQKTQKKSFQSTRRLSAKRAPGRNRARDHPLQRRTRDHRATSPAAEPRRARGSAAAKRARPRKRASLARCKICDFGPELGFEQRNRFRSLRDTHRTKKKVLRKPPAGAPVVGQTFKYIY